MSQQKRSPYGYKRFDRIAMGPPEQLIKDMKAGYEYEADMKLRALLDTVELAAAFLSKMDNITSEQFSRSVERKEREALREALIQLGWDGNK